MSLAQPLAELLEAADRPLEDARAMPPGVYTNPEFLSLEI